MRVAIHTLGCKVNQYESQAMEEILTSRGHTLVPFEAPADVYIVNSCTVTATSDKKSRQAVRQARKRAPNALVALCGCYPQVSPEDARKIDADLIGGSGDRQGFLNLLEQMAEGKNQTETVENLDDPFRRRVFEALPAGGLEGRTRAMLKVEDGCTNFCTYCIIPYARGPVRSLPLARAVALAEGLAADGYREIVLTGIEIASWGWDFKDGSKLVDLVEAVCRAVPQVRVRLGSLEPRTVDEEFCRRLSACENLCPQFHLSMQSGSDGVLRRMRRKYDSARYFQSVELLNAAFPGCAVTTDMIVGFPGETEAEFAESLAFAERCGFAAMHVFPYSRRPGTPAASMPGQLTRAEKEERAAKAGALARSLRERYDTALLGKPQEVLFEQIEDGFFTGHARNGVKVYLRGEDLHNQIRIVTPTALRADGVEAKPAAQ